MSTGDVLPSGCPPEGHEPADGTFFRLADPRHDPGEATEADSWILPVNNPTSRQCFGQTDRCGCFGHSLFADVEVLHRARKTLRWARKKSIARVKLTPDMGRILESHSPVGSTHYDWWPTPLSLVPDAEVLEAQL